MHVPFDRNVKIRNPVKDEIYKWLIALLAHKLNERLGLQGLPELEGRQAVLRKRVVPLIEN